MLHSRMLAYLDEVARAGSIRRAAERLGIAASSINRQIITLEEEYGVPLFERLPRRPRLTVAGDTIDFFGVSDAHRQWDRLEDLPAAIDALGPREPGTSVLGGTHAPYQRVMNRYIELGADAIFGGHTHGGQVCLPGFGALVANCDIPLTQAKGLSTWTQGGRTVPLNVSAGCGHSIYAPVRFACRPEATLLTLTARG